jgi:hypothetical protein
MIEAVKEVAQSSDKSYGSRRMKHALNALGYPVGQRSRLSFLLRRLTVLYRRIKPYSNMSLERATAERLHKSGVIQHSPITCRCVNP